MNENLIQVKIFTESYVDRLYRDLKSTENYDNYYLEKFPSEERYPKGDTNIFIQEGFDLNPDLSDADNSIALYEVLNLNETQASDSRLWTYFTHVIFWKYMRERWALEGVRKGDSPFGRIKDRYFLINPSLESLTRNGISRLWWYAHLTIDENENRKDKYELLRVLLRRQDIAAGITERLIVANKNMRFGVLEFLKNNEEIAANEDLTRKLLRDLILYGGPKVLPFLEKEEIMQILGMIRLAA